MPTAVRRRYTPPTCTLEVAASGSALSRWTDRPVLKNLRFQLNFDDPKLMPDQQITVSGDQSQLEALYEAVSDYVQHLVGSPASAINWEPSLRLDQPEDAQITLQASDLPPVDMPPDRPESKVGIVLQPQGLLSHELSFGDLASPESGLAVRLSTLQLFDLANALEDYHTESLSLPVAERSTWMSKLPRRLPTAAAAVLALGATGVMAKFVLDISRPAAIQTASAPAERQVNAELNRELFPTLSPPPVSPSATIQPLPPPPPNATPSDALGLPPIGVTQAPPPAASKSGSAGQIPGQIPGQLPSQLPASSSGQSQVAIIPGSGVASLPSADLDAPAGQADVVANSPPRLAPDASVLESGAESRAMPQSASQSASREINQAAAAPVASSPTAFDTIPQVAEVRSYFQQRWQPPDGLSQTLEYRLLLNADGSLQRIVPLGQFSENYLDRTDMPLLGEPFVSAARNGQTPQIRLVLKPDGKVQSFLEYAN
jgi:hypothetical protein